MTRQVDDIAATLLSAGSSILGSLVAVPQGLIGDCLISMPVFAQVAPAYRRYLPNRRGHMFPQLPVGTS